MRARYLILLAAAAFFGAKARPTSITEPLMMKATTAASRKVAVTSFFAHKFKHYADAIKTAKLNWDYDKLVANEASSMKAYESFGLSKVKINTNLFAHAKFSTWVQYTKDFYGGSPVGEKVMRFVLMKHIPDTGARFKTLLAGTKVKDNNVKNIATDLLTLEALNLEKKNVNTLFNWLQLNSNLDDLNDPAVQAWIAFLTHLHHDYPGDIAEVNTALQFIYKDDTATLTKILKSVETSLAAKFPGH